jgi:hypothetical protein
MPAAREAHRHSNAAYDWLSDAENSTAWGIWSIFVRRSNSFA